MKNKSKYETSWYEPGLFIGKIESDIDELWEKEMDKERAWLFYESGVQDMRENKSLFWVYKF